MVPTAGFEPATLACRASMIPFQQAGKSHKLFFLGAGTESRTLTFNLEG